MVMAPFIEHYSDQISGTLSCFDRIVIRGTLPGFSYSEGMTRYLNVNHIRIFDYPMFTNPLRTDLRDNAEQIAKENSLKIEYMSLWQNQYFANFHTHLFQSRPTDTFI
jgi:hypothetical protein